MSTSIVIAPEDAATLRDVAATDLEAFSEAAAGSTVPEDVAANRRWAEQASKVIDALAGEGPRTVKIEDPEAFYSAIGNRISWPLSESQDYAEGLAELKSLTRLLETFGNAARGD